MSERIAKVDITSLFVNDQKHRLEVGIPALAESIQTIGQMHPIIVKRVGKEYQVISGRRRYAALTYIQEELTPDKKVKALVNIKDIDQLKEELIKIDENVMRHQLDEIEFDEAIYRRKQIYEEIHPETKQHAAGGHGKNKKGSKKGKPAQTFTHDAAGKLNVSKRTVEMAIFRASRASDQVKKARADGLGQSKVDLLASLEPKDQDLLLPFVKKMDVSETKNLISETQKHGAKAAILYLADVKPEDPRLRPLIKSATSLADLIQEALKERLTFEGDGKHDSVRALDDLAKRISEFTSFQRSALGYVRAISRKGGEFKRIRGRA